MKSIKNKIGKKRLNKNNTKKLKGGTNELELSTREGELRELIGIEADKDAPITKFYDKLIYNENSYLNQILRCETIPGFVERMEDLLTYINQYKNGQNDESTNQEYIKKIIYLFFFITLSRDGNSLIYLLRILDIFDYSLKIDNDTSLDGILKKLIIVAVSDNGYCFDTIIE